MKERFTPDGRRKIFCVGFNKTATTSLHAFFREIGFRSYHGPAWRKPDDPAIYDRYDCFSDGVPYDFRRLDRQFPGSKFILQVRDLDSWIASRLEHVARQIAGGWTPRHVGWDDTDESIRGWITRRNKRHFAVLKHFKDRPDDLLIINYIRDPCAVEKLCAFLGQEPRVPKPHRNQNPSGDSLTRHLSRIERIVLGMGASTSELKHDILVRSLLSEESRHRFPQDSSQLADRALHQEVGGLLNQ